MISLTRADGAPVASFGAGVAFSNSQAQVNPGQYSDAKAFGAGEPAPISDTGQFENLSNAAGTRGAPTGALSGPELIDPASRTSTTTNAITKTLGEVGSTKMGYVDMTEGHNGFAGGGGSLYGGSGSGKAGTPQLLAKIPMGKAPTPKKPGTPDSTRASEFDRGQQEARPQLPGSPEPGSPEPGSPTEPSSAPTTPKPKPPGGLGEAAEGAADVAEAVA